MSKEGRNGFGLDYRSQNRSDQPGLNPEISGRSLNESHGGDLPEMPHMNWHGAVAIITLGGVVVVGTIIKAVQKIIGE